MFKNNFFNQIKLLLKMCDYYAFSDELMDFIDDIKQQIKKENKFLREIKKNKIDDILNLEIAIHSCKRVEINIFTDYSVLYKIFINKLREKENNLLNLCKKQSFIYPEHVIMYNHILDIEEFEFTRKRDVYYNTIVKYYI